MRPHFPFILQATAGLLTAVAFFNLSLTPSAEQLTHHAPVIQDATEPAVLTTADSAATNPDAPSRVSPAVPEPVQPVVIEHGRRDEKAIALTFDACSTRQPSEYDERVTQALTSTGTPATLFLGGKWMQEQPEHTKRLAANPLFEIGNHTFLHPHLREISEDHIRRELQETQDILDSLTGRRATLFRPPYGEYDERAVRIAASLGLRTVQFDLASGDPDPAIGHDRLIQYVSSMARNGSIIVMHVNRRGRHTADALPAIISRLRQRGFVFRTVSDLLHLPTHPDSATNILEHN
jgi:peptidoglycan/xylan/chitin deacetylase (PgdA/CDA1 family)